MASRCTLAGIPRHSRGMPISILPSPKAVLGLLLLCAACDGGPLVEKAERAACVIEVDGSQWMGAVDGLTDNLTLRYFDGEGRVEREEFDTNGDGGIDEFAVHYYNEEGRRYLFERFHSASQLLRGREERAFDVDGREVLRNEDRNGDGFIDKTTATLFEGEQALVIETHHDGSLPTYETRWGRHGTIEWTATSSYEVRRVSYRYNELGLLARSETFADEILVSTVEHRYNKVGQKSTSLAIFDEGTSLQTYSHDERGFINGWVLDEGRDGTIDALAVCVFDDEGRMTSEHMDTDNDGVFDHIETSSFDDHGRLLHSETDWDSEWGSVERLVTYRYQCDEK